MKKICIKNTLIPKSPSNEILRSYDDFKTDIENDHINDYAWDKAKDYSNRIINKFLWNNP